MLDDLTFNEDKVHEIITKLYDGTPVESSDDKTMSMAYATAEKIKDKLPTEEPINNSLPPSINSGIYNLISAPTHQTKNIRISVVVDELTNDFPVVYIEYLRISLGLLNEELTKYEFGNTHEYEEPIVKCRVYSLNFNLIVYFVTGNCANMIRESDLIIDCTDKNNHDEFIREITDIDKIYRHIDMATDIAIPKKSPNVMTATEVAFKQQQYNIDMRDRVDTLKVLYNSGLINASALSTIKTDII